jgi:DNA-binding CsgD family transcriptional regulator
MRPWHDIRLRLQTIFKQPNETQRPHFIPIHPDLLAAITEIAVLDDSSVGVVVNDLLGFALAERQSSHDSLETWYQLTQREREAAALVWFGLTNKEIAKRMVISVHTVKAHMRSVLAKFNVHSKDELRTALTGLDFSEWENLWAASPQSSKNDDT